MLIHMNYSVNYFLLDVPELETWAYFKYTINSHYQYVENTTAEFEDQNIPFTTTFCRAMTTAVGSLMILRTFRMIVPASFVAWRWESSKRIGHRDHSVRDGCAQVNFRNFLHLDENHQEDLFGEKRFPFALVIIRNV